MYPNVKYNEFLHGAVATDGGTCDWEHGPGRVDLGEAVRAAWYSQGGSEEAARPAVGAGHRDIIHAVRWGKGVVRVGWSSWHRYGGGVRGGAHRPCQCLWHGAAVETGGPCDRGHG
jgi:hypothetical protein